MTGHAKKPFAFNFAIEDFQSRHVSVEGGCWLFTNTQARSDSGTCFERQTRIYAGWCPISISKCEERRKSRWGREFSRVWEAVCLDLAYRIKGERKRKQPRKAVEGVKIAAAKVVSPDGWMSEFTLDERSEAWSPIVPSASGRRATDRGLLPIKLSEYLRLLDWSGRQLRVDKRGAISNDLPPILERLGINGAKWLKLVTEFDRLFTTVVGSAEKLLDRATKAGRRWYRGQVACREAFG